MAHSDHDHSHDHLPQGKVFVAALALTLAFAAIEAAGGWWANSLALWGDAGHMLSDTATLGLAALGAWMANRPPSEKHSFGLGRAEVLAALINALLMLLVVAAITYEAVNRIRHPPAVGGLLVIVIAAAGLLVNAWIVKILHGGGESLNTRAALIHVFGDLLGSAAVLISGFVIYFAGWTLIDPILSLFINLLILIATGRLLNEALHVMMEGVPRGLNLTEIGVSLARLEGVLSVHDLHVWTVSSGTVALSAHVMVSDLAGWELLLGRLQAHLKQHYDIRHVTLQPEPVTRVILPADKLIDSGDAAPPPPKKLSR